MCEKYLTLPLYHNFGTSKVQNSCTEKKPRAQEAPFYWPFELSHFAEETILNARLLSNRKSNARKSEFRAIDYGRYRAEFRAIDVEVLLHLFLSSR